MSFYNDASLVFLPSGGAGKDTKAYSIKPTDGSGDFTFSRGSNLTATRVNSNGLIEKGRENLLLQSNQFDTTWGTPKTDVTSGQSGYDGSSDAWLLEADIAGSSANMNQAVSISGVMTASIYAKEGTTNWFRFSINDSGVNTRAWFDLSGSGAVGTTAGNIIDTKIESVGNGYFRCSITFNATAANLYIFIANADNSISYSVGDNIYIQDAQLEQGLVATEYIESGASTGLAGILEDSPRFDYSGGASCPSLLLEPQRTNIFNSSEYLTSIDSDITQSVSSVDSPISGVPYLKLLKSNSGVARIIKTSSAGVYTYSVFAKQGSTNGNIIQFADSYYGTSTLDVEFNLTTGAFIGTPSGNGLIDADFEDFGNGSYRVWVTYNHDSVSAGTEVRTPSIFFDNAQLNVGEYIYLTGFQVEAGSYPTSYIPNHSAGSVTRNADVCTNSTGGVSQTEGTIFIDYKDSPNKDVLFACSTSSGLITNNIRLSYNQLYIRNSTGNLVVGSVTLPDAGKLAIKYDTNGVKIFSNGNSTPIFTNSTSISFDGTVNFVRIGSKVNNTGIQEFNVDQFLIFTTALSDANCVTLTS